VLIFGVLAHGLHGAAHALRLMVPVALGIALTAATLVAAHEPLSVLRLVALLPGPGRGHQLRAAFARAAAAREDARRTPGRWRSSAARRCAAFACWLSRIAVLPVIGTTVCIGVVYSLLCCAPLLFARDPPEGLAPACVRCQSVRCPSSRRR
jgi:predicted exporter